MKLIMLCATIYYIFWALDVTGLLCNKLEEAKGLESVGWLQIDSNLLVMVEIVTVTTMRND